MGKAIRYSDEFKQEAVNQVAIHGYAVNDVAERLGISSDLSPSLFVTGRT